ncbi:hypothetical protein FN846DRAFT_952283 [Sphaerosporella brunnea]|uniref:Protein kinase domain-containing protein n=1 Tax=Sphaerosporella brunnea TaxID=1250544 RepID=A0A5J5EV96_9PEZI|nr:hypothetical protein FN846DRAFT_952283 [Sphaerosporella brunnea]
MPSASILAATTLSPPPSGQIVARAFQSSILNAEYDEILPETLVEVANSDIADFRRFLGTIPFQFAEIPLTTEGLYLENEADVRMFLEPALVLACWPIILAMVEKDGRDFDLALRAGTGAQPDVSILKLYTPVSAGNGSVSLQLGPLSAVEYKGPDVLGNVVKDQDFTLRRRDNDDWDTVASQLRKYAIRNKVKNVVFVDNRWLIYLHFTKATDIGAECRYVVSSIAGQGRARMTARETLLFSIYNSLVDDTISLRDYITVPVNDSNLDYVPIFPGVTAGVAPARNAPTSTHSLRSTGFPGHQTLMLNPTSREEFPLCGIDADDLTPIRIRGMQDSRFLGSNRREVKDFFISGAWITNLPFDVDGQLGKVSFSSRGEQSRPTTPSPTTGLVLKFFELQNLVAAYCEATAYRALKNLQGLIIPYCYGVYQVDGRDGVGLLLEKIQAPTLDETLRDANSVEEIRMVFLACWEGLLHLHNAGYAHRDVRASNIMISSSQVVFIDFENSAPINRTNKKFDQINLRLIFREYGGISQQTLREWAEA